MMENGYKIASAFVAKATFWQSFKKMQKGEALNNYAIFHALCHLTYLSMTMADNVCTVYALAYEWVCMYRGCAYDV